MVGQFETVKVSGRDLQVHRFWSSRSVREACINNELYTHGDNHDYMLMLRNVEVLIPVLENLYSIARDISRHSGEWSTVEDVMTILEREAVITSYSFVPA